MTNIKYAIAPEYRFRRMFNYLLFAIGLMLIIFSVSTNDGGTGIFIGVIFLIIGVFYLIFTSKQDLTIDNEKIVLETKSVVNFFDESLVVKFVDIKEVYYLRRQVMIGNIFNKSPYADYEDRRIISPERIIINLNERRSETILRIGDTEQFQQAYKIIQELIKKQKGNN